MMKTTATKPGIRCNRSFCCFLSNNDILVRSSSDIMMMMMMMIILVLLFVTDFKYSTNNNNNNNRIHIEAFQIPYRLITKSQKIQNSYEIDLIFHTTKCNQRRQQQKEQQRCEEQLLYLSSDDWSNFKGVDDDLDDIIITGKQIDRRSYATENDDSDVKVAVGLGIDAPIILNDAEPLFVPPGSQLELDEQTVLQLLSACRIELGTLFGYTAENRGVGITGSVEFVEVDAGTVIISLNGRYWHQRTTVLDRIANYLQQRIPEIISVDVIDQYQLTDEANND